MARMIRPISGAPSPSIVFLQEVGVPATLRRDGSGNSPVRGAAATPLLGGGRPVRALVGPLGGGPVGGRLGLGQQRLHVPLQAPQLAAEPAGGAEQAVAEDAE